MQEILRRSGNNIKIEYLPLAKSIQLFDQNRNACYPTARKLAFGFLGHDVIDVGVALNKFKIVIATPKSDPLVSSIESLRNRSVAAINGNVLSAYGIPVSHTTIHYVNTYEQSVKLLEKGRVNAIVGSAIALMPYRDKLNFDVDNPVFSVDEGIVCHPGDESRAFLESIRPAIQSMKADGSLKSILGEYYLLD
jgi:ABC-type amino acid transport substrate-binding protein